jgi:sterol desaturase/sphingolipid hydroxylase (fatty acid hydroxylase superfamily)
MTLEHWIYAVTYISIFSFLIVERYKQEHVFSITKRDVLFLIIDVIAKLVNLTLSVYAILWVVNLIAPLEILSVSNLPISKFLSVVMAFLLVDFFHYFSHRLHHKIPTLWRFHRLHHADKKVDALTTVLHHPFEMASSFLVNITCYVLFDIPVIIILTHAFIAGLHSPFTHTRMLLPEKLDKFLSYFIISPNFHRLHHSLDIKEGNSNFGIIFPFWDRLFGTRFYKDNIQMQAMQFGLSADKSPESLTFKELLVNPFR